MSPTWQPAPTADELRSRRQISKAIEFAEYAVKRARAGDLDVIHNMTAGVDTQGLRIVVAVLAEAFAGATGEQETVGDALAAQQAADTRRSA
jgi:hypothetical protein